MPNLKPGQVRVSVIIIFLNAERFIKEAVSSVFAQTYRAWELLLVDDGSTDASTEIARNYAHEKGDRVRYFEHAGHENRGMSASRNLGISHARGDYVAFLDADDVWLPQKLEQQVAILDEQPEASMMYGNTQYWYSWTGKDEDRRRDYNPDLGVQARTLYKPPTLVPLFVSGRAAVPCTCSLLVRRKALERIGGFEESFRGMYEDQAFYAKMCLNEGVYVIDLSLERYRQHADSNCALAEKTRTADKARMTFLNWLGAYLTENEINDKKTWRALRFAQWQLRNPIPARLTRQLSRLISRIIKKYKLPQQLSAYL